MLLFTNTHTTIFTYMIWYDAGPKEILCGVMNYIDFAPEMLIWRSHMNMLMNSWIHKVHVSFLPDERYLLVNVFAAFTCRIIRNRLRCHGLKLWARASRTRAYSLIKHWLWPSNHRQACIRIYCPKIPVLRVFPQSCAWWNRASICMPLIKYKC
jgi:hypothetical protein